MSLERYVAGQHRQVWTELLGIGPEVCGDPEAEAVADETIARIARNLARLRDALPRIGYRFDHPERVLVGPPDDVDEQIARVEAVIGPLPLAVAAFWRTIGSVDFSGEHPDWPHRLLDPLMFELSADYAVDTYEDMIEQGELAPGDPFAVDFAPDDLHKADISGGPPYAVHAPNPAADGIVLWEIHQTTFVNYLRTVIGHAGMGGLSPVKRHGHPVLPVPPEVVELAATLEPF